MRRIVRAIRAGLILAALPGPHYSRPLSGAEAREFVPFMHELIGIAFAMIDRYFLAGTAVQVKGDTSPVTLADRNAEAAMRAAIERQYPSHAVIGEEHGDKPGKRYRWVLDPIDGTRAFITNCFLFGTLIALERDDGDGFRPVLGVIGHAAAGVALMGHSGGTTLYRRNGKARRVRVRPCESLADATVLATTHWSTGEQRGGPAVERIIQQAKLYRTWGDCFGYFALATGAADVMLDPSLAYWDVAAIIPVVEGAGGTVSAWGGGDPLATPSLIASSARLHAAVLEILRGQPAQVAQ